MKSIHKYKIEMINVHDILVKCLSLVHPILTDEFIYNGLYKIKNN